MKGPRNLMKYPNEKLVMKEPKSAMKYPNEKSMKW